MRGFLKLAIVVAVVYLGGQFVAEKKANSMIDVAAAMARDGRYEEALEQLDSVQSWLSWTDAASRIEDERTVVRKRMQEIDEQKAWERRIAEQDRRWEEDEARRVEHERRLELERERHERQLELEEARQLELQRQERKPLENGRR